MAGTFRLRLLVFPFHVSTGGNYGSFRVGYSHFLDFRVAGTDREGGFLPEG